MMKPMSKHDPADEVVRQNLAKFRDQAGLSQAQAADLSGVPLYNLQRYESGQVATIPFPAIAALAKVYGRSIDDFASAAPPPAPKEEDLPVFFLRTRPGAEIDPKIFKELQELLDKANREARRKPKR